MAKKRDAGVPTKTPSRRPFTLDELLSGMTSDREHPLEDDAPQGEEML